MYMSTITTVINSLSDVQAYESLLAQREAIMVSEGFQQWRAELNVSRSYVEPEGAIRAKQLNDQYDFSTSSPKSSFVQFLKLKGIW